MRTSFTRGDAGRNERRQDCGEPTGGANIIHLAQEPPSDTVRQRLERSRQKLFAIREKRIHPHKDDKVLTDWNGLMIAALAASAQGGG